MLPRRLSTTLCLMAIAAPEALASAAEPAPGPLDHWLVRASGGLGNTLDSAQSELLAKDGYVLSRRWWLMADGGYGVVGTHLGPWVAWSQATSDGVEPALRREDLLFGGQALWLMAQEPLQFAFTGRIGAARSELGFTGEAKPSWGWALGFDAQVVIPVAYVGLGAGALYAPVEAPSPLGRPYNVGGFYVSLSLVAGG